MFTELVQRAITPATALAQEYADSYESMAMQDRYHPQTIRAYKLNDTPLDIPHGAPLRLRFERQLGYKQAKYVNRIELVESLAGTGTAALSIDSPGDRRKWASPNLNRTRSGS